MRSRRAAVFLSILPLGLGLGVAACGDDSSGGTTTGPTALTAEQWRTQVDAICADFQKRIDAVAAPTDAGAVQAYVESVRALGSEQLSKIRALTPPDELASVAREGIANQEAAVALTDKVIERIAGGEDATKVIADLSSEGDRIEAEGDRLAKEAGLTECGSGGDDTSTTETTASTEETTASTDDTAISIPTTGDAEIDRYLGDVQEAVNALTAFGTALQNVGSVEDIQKQASSLRGRLGEFDTAIGKLDGYTLSNATLETQRKGLIEKGPALSDTLRKFVDAAADADLEKLGTIGAELATALQGFVTAAQPTP